MNLKLLNLNSRCAIVSLLLMAIIWPGPRPIVHCHAALAKSDPTALSRHLEISHDFANCGLDPNKPHIHWAFSFVRDKVLEASPENDAVFSARNGEVSPTSEELSNDLRAEQELDRYQSPANYDCRLSASNFSSHKYRLSFAVSVSVMYCSMTC